MTEEIPARPNPDMDLGRGRRWIRDFATQDVHGQKPLHKAFDLTVSTEYAPMLLQAAEVDRMHQRFPVNTPEAIESYFIKPKSEGG